MKFHGEAIIELTQCNKHNGKSFALKQFEAEANKTYTALENAHMMALRSLFRRMKTEKDKDDNLIYEGVKVEDIRLSIYPEPIPEPEPKPEPKDVVDGQISLF